MKIDGLDDLIRDLQAIEKANAKVLRTIVKDASNPVLQKAKSLAPVSKSGSHGRAPGELRNSLEAGFERAKINKRVINIRSKKGRAVDEKGRPYSQFIEYGRAKGKRGIVQPKPFMRPAIEQGYETAKRTIENALLEAFDRGIK